jgi:hypothetical protein
LSAWRLEVDVGQEAAILPLRVWAQVEQVIEEAPGVVFVVMRWVGCTSRQSEEAAGFEMAVF